MTQNNIGNQFDVGSLKDVPHQPGCYLWKDKQNKILYIGKAKNLNKRMHQYFNKVHNNRINKMISLIAGFDYIVVSDENDALILENNLIKKHKPKFNVLLKEGSNSYPYILVTNTKDPKIVYTRKYNPLKGKFYGPFAASDANPYELFLYLNRIIPFRKCNVLPRQKCMYYDLGQCLGPCIKQIDGSTYDFYKNKIDDIFNNRNNKDILNELKQKEKQASDQLDFEQAQYYLKLQNYLESIVHKQVVQLKELINADYVGFYCNEINLCINIFNYIDGKLVSKHAAISEYYGEINEMLVSYLMQYYSDNMIPKQIFLSLDDENLKLLSVSLNTNVFKPIKGMHLDLLTQSITNAQYYLTKNKLSFENKKARTYGACNDLANLLSIDSANYIEMIDNSNMFLQTPVSAVVVFKNGMPERKMYRKYNLEYLENKSDYHFMKEVIFRRMKKMIDSHEVLPDVFIVDGGKIQINAAKEIFEQLEINHIIKLIGLKKDEHHKTDAIVLDDGKEIKIDKTSNLFLMLSNIQNEVHNFVISHFRNKDIKSKLSSFLDDIEGIGPKTKAKILNIYSNLADLKNVKLEALEQIMPKKVAIKLKEKASEVFKND